MAKYKKDTRVVLYRGKNKRLVDDENYNLFEAFSLDAISIIQLVLESVKKDHNLASIIARSVPFIENMLKCMAFILQNVSNMNQESSQEILDSLFFSCMTLLHYLLSHAEEDTFKVLCNLFSQTSKLFYKEDPMNEHNETSVEEYDHFWPLLLEIIKNSDVLEVHYSTIRLVASLIQCFNKFANRQTSLEVICNTGDEVSYGTLLCYQFCMIFKKVYFPRKSEKQDFTDSFKTDICSCLSMLLLNSQDAKMAAIKEGLVQKLSEKANDYCCAYRVGNVQQPGKSQTKDSIFFERECIRLLRILKNTFYNAGSQLESEITESQNSETGFAYNPKECPTTVQKLIEVYENVAKETHSAIFIEIGEVLCTLCAQSTEIKKFFSLPLRNKKYTGIRVVLKSLKSLNFKSDGPEVKLIFNLISSLCLVSENIKQIIKEKIIEEIIPNLWQSIKSEKDIINSEIYITWFIKFLAAFTHNEEGIKAIVIHNKVFDLVLFCVENLTPPSAREDDVILQLFINSMLFFGNSSAYRKNKLHFLSNPKFLTNILTILDSKEYPLKVKAFAAQTLSIAIYNHQGMKAAWGKQIYEGLNSIKRDLENFDEQTDSELLESIGFTDEADKRYFLQLQSKYKYVCIQALTNLDL